MKNLFKKQSAKFVQNLSRFTKVMVKHILVCFYAPQCMFIMWFITHADYRSRVIRVVTAVRL